MKNGKESNENGNIDLFFVKSLGYKKKGCWCSNKKIN